MKRFRWGLVLVASRLVGGHKRQLQSRLRKSELSATVLKSLRSRRVVEQKRFDVTIGPVRIESLLQHPSCFVVAFLLEAIVQLTFITIDRRSRIPSFAAGIAYCLVEHRKNVGDMLLKKVLFIRPIWTDKAHMR